MGGLSAGGPSGKVQPSHRPVDVQAEGPFQHPLSTWQGSTQPFE